jgi:hypothetical protein
MDDVTDGLIELSPARAEIEHIRSLAQPAQGWPANPFEQKLSSGWTGD